MSSFKNAPPEIYDTAGRIIAEHYGEFLAIGVTLNILFAYAPENEEGEKVGTALKSHGVPADGIASVTPLKYRVLGCADGQIALDGDRFENLTAEQAEALIAHELHHFVIARKADGEVIYDTHGRPKLKLRHHDIEMGWFIDIAKRYGMDSGECRQAQEIVQTLGQIFMPFLDGAASPRPETPHLKAPRKKKTEATE